MPDHNMPSTQDVQQQLGQQQIGEHTLIDGSVMPFPSQGLTREFWTEEMLRLSRVEHDLPWRSGDCWNAGAVFGHGVRKAIVTSPAWQASGGLAHGTLRNRGAVAHRFRKMSRRSDISYSHHAAVMCIKDDAAAFAVLDDAVRYGWSDNRTAIEAKRVQVWLLRYA